MAIFSKILIVSGLAALVAGRPLAIRDVTSVETETAWSTVDVVQTVWVDSNGTPVSTGAPGMFAPQPAAATTTQAAAPAASTPTIAAQAQTYTTPTTTPAAAAYTPPAAMPSVASTSAAVAPSASPSQSSTSGGSSGSTGGIASGSSTATCEGEDDACQGDITHWDGGLGACGWNVDTNSDYQIALPYQFMGTLSNSNPYCGKSLTIQNPTTGATVQATVGDKCMGCQGRSIDLTDVLFQAIGPECNGRCSGFNWWFN